MAQSSEYKGKIYGSPLKDVLDAIIKQAIVDTNIHQMNMLELREKLKEYLFEKKTSGDHRFLCQLEERLKHWRILTSSKNKEKYIREKLKCSINKHLPRILDELIEGNR